MNRYCLVIFLLSILSSVFTTVRSDVLATTVDTATLEIFWPDELCKADENFKKLIPFSCFLRKLKIFVIPPSSMLPETQDESKRPYHVLECLQGLGHTTYTLPMNPSTIDPSELDKNLLSSLKNNHILEGNVSRSAMSTPFLMENIESIRPDAVILWIKFWEPDHHFHEKNMVEMKNRFPEMKIVVFTG